MDFNSSANTYDHDSLNVNGSDDPFYRYKMPALAVTIIELNGGTTVITNIDAVAAAIYRKSADLKAHFQKQLSRNAQIKPTGLHVSGRLTAPVLQAALQKYIQTQVLCDRCGCPETHGKTKSCSACGHATRAK